MQLLNHTPFPTITFSAKDLHGQPSQVLVIRATYDITADGRLAVSDKQTPIVLTDEYFGEMNRSSVRQESDLVPFKPKCDVIVNATAHAPGGVPVSAFHVGITIAGAEINTSGTRAPVLEKKLLVTGPRFWEKSQRGQWLLSSPTALIAALPLRYEQAFGGQCRIDHSDPAAGTVGQEYRLTVEQRASHPDGPDGAPLAHAACESNPLGMGFVTEWYLAAKKMGTVPVPHIVHPLHGPHPPGSWSEPQGFGIIAKSWRQRRQLAGTFDAAWLEQCWPDMPRDFDPAYWNGAHPDLQIPHLAGGEQVTLTNLTAAGTLRFNLPEQSPMVQVTYQNGQSRCVAALLDTLIIDGDAMVVSSVWRAAIPFPEALLFVKTEVVAEPVQ